MKNLGAIILAGGRGKRMQITTTNKVVLHLANKPIILHAVHLLERLKIRPIVIVVGFAKDSVMQALKDSSVLFAEQKKQLGTANAAQAGLEKLPQSIEHVLVIQGDDSAFYKEDTITALVTKHFASRAAVTFLTIEYDNPYGLGRIIRNAKGDVIAMVEEKDATGEQRKIKEINPACYVFNVAFLKKYLPMIKKSPVTEEYYLTHIIDIAIKHKEKIETVQGGRLPWRGVNTPIELEDARQLFLETQTV